MVSKTEKVFVIGLAIFLVIGLSWSFVRMTWIPKTKPEPPKPAAATIKITENNGNVFWTDKLVGFNEGGKCVVFVALPAGTNTVVCGNFRMEGMQSAIPQAH